MTVFCIAAGLLCLCYFFFLLLYTGFTSAFYLIWPAMGAGFLLLGRLFRIRFWQLLPGIIRCLLLGAVILGIFFFAAVEGMILRGALTVPEKGLDYVVVLGAHVRPEGPSRALRLRLERALTYARENPSAILIVSGGQGDHEKLAGIPRHGPGTYSGRGPIKKHQAEPGIFQKNDSGRRLRGHCQQRLSHLPRPAPGRNPGL